MGDIDDALPRAEYEAVTKAPSKTPLVQMRLLLKDATQLEACLTKWWAEAVMETAAPIEAATAGPGLTSMTTGRVAFATAVAAKVEEREAALDCAEAALHIVERDRIGKR